MHDVLEHPEVCDERVGDEDKDCIYCQCRPSVMFCGRLENGQPGEGAWYDEDMCPECIRVLDETGCPNCGCDENGSCRLCDPRPWWRRWF